MREMMQFVGSQSKPFLGAFTLIDRNGSELDQGTMHGKLYAAYGRACRETFGMVGDFSTWASPILSRSLIESCNICRRRTTALLLKLLHHSIASDQERADNYDLIIQSRLRGFKSVNNFRHAIGA
jgi:hypothetical protein